MTLQDNPPPFGSYVAGLVREGDPDRFFATLFAPASHRDALFALYAFNLDIARVRETIRDPMAGEIRFQWWRDAIMGSARGEIAAHPVASELLKAADTYRLPPQALLDLIDARTFDLYDDPMPGMGDLEGYCGETSSVLFRLAAIIACGGEDPGGADATGHAGMAYALTGLLRAFPWHAARGQVYLPMDRLKAAGVTRDDIVSGRGGPGLDLVLAEMRASARQHLGAFRTRRRDIHPGAAHVFLPLALVEPYLARMDRADYRPFDTQIELPLWRKQASLWLNAKTGRL